MNDKGQTMRYERTQGKVKKNVNSFGEHYFICDDDSTIVIDRENIIKQLNAVPMENIDKMIAEIENLDTIGFLEDDVFSKSKPMIFQNDVLEIINKYCKGEKTDGCSS